MFERRTNIFMHAVLEIFERRINIFMWRLKYLTDTRIYWERASKLWKPLALHTCEPVTPTARVRRPLRERLVEICFSPFNTGDGLSLVARKATSPTCALPRPRSEWVPDWTVLLACFNSFHRRDGTRVCMLCRE